MIKRPALRRLAVTLSTATSLASVAHAQVVWGGATIGESLQALQRMFPAAERPARPQVLSAGEVEVLAVPGEPLDGVKSRAHFFMRDGKLSSVQLRPVALPTGPAASALNLAFARRVAQGLTGTGAPPFSCVDNRFAAIARLECRWLRGDVVIHESYLDVAGQAPVFYVAYRRADDPAFDS